MGMPIYWQSGFTAYPLDLQAVVQCDDDFTVISDDAVAFYPLLLLLPMRWKVSRWAS